MVYFDSRRSYVLTVVCILIIIALVGFLIWWFLKPHQEFCKKGGCASSSDMPDTYHPGHSASSSSSQSLSNGSQSNTPSVTLSELINIGISQMKLVIPNMTYVGFILKDQQQTPFGAIHIYKPSCTGYLMSSRAIPPKITQQDLVHYTPGIPNTENFTDELRTIHPFTLPYMIQIVDKNKDGTDYIVTDY